MTPRNQSVLVSSAVDAYLHDVGQRGRSEKTLQKLRTILQRFCRFLQERKQGPAISELSLGQAQAFIEQLGGPIVKYSSHPLIAPRPDSRYSAWTLRNYITVLRAFSRWLYAHHFTPRFVFARLKMPERPKTPSPALTRSDLARVLAHINRATSRGKRLYAIVAIIVEGLLRPSELVALQLTDLDGPFLTITSRRRARQIVPLSTETQRALQSYIKNVRPSTDSANLFLNDAGEPLTVNALTHMLCRLARRSDVSALNANTLRRFGSGVSSLAQLDKRTVRERDEF